MSDFIGFDITDIKVLQGKLNRLPAAVRDAVADEVGAYLFEVFRDQPAPKYVTRRAAYGRAFQTDRQRRWFFWALDAGVIRVPYKRTGQMRNAWRKIGSGANLIIVNESEAAVWTMDDNRQARLNKLVGWKTIRDHLRERSGQIQRRANIGAKKGIRKAGIK